MAWHCTKIGAPNSNNGNGYKEFILDSGADMDVSGANDPEEFKPIAPGSVAYTCEPGGMAMQQMWMRASNSTWVEM